MNDPDITNLMRAATERQLAVAALQKKYERGFAASRAGGDFLGRAFAGAIFLQGLLNSAIPLADLGKV